MWTPDDFPGADNVPWPLLIRARYAHEFDAVIASGVVRSISHVASAELTAHVAHVANAAVKRSMAEPVELGAEQRVSALEQIADWDGELCPRWWRWPFPPKPRGLSEIDDPLVYLALGEALEFASIAGSAVLNDGLAELGGIDVR